MNLMTFVPCWWHRHLTFCRYDMFAVKSPNVFVPQMYFPTAAVFFGILLFQVCWDPFVFVNFFLYGLDGVVCTVLHCVACIALDGFAMFCMSADWLLISFLPTDAYRYMYLLWWFVHFAIAHQVLHVMNPPGHEDDRQQSVQDVFNNSSHLGQQNSWNPQGLACGDPFPKKFKVSGGS